MEQYCLRWDKHQPNFVSAFSNLLSCEALLDVTLAAEEKYLQAHKVVLSACSSYFQTLFTVNPCKHPIVILKDVQFNDLKIMIDFIYKGEVNVSPEELPNFLKTGELLKIRGVSEIAFDQLVAMDDTTLDLPAAKTLGDSNNSSEHVPRPTTPPCSVSPGGRSRRKRLRKSSTGSGSSSPERPAEKQQITIAEIFSCHEEETHIKLEPENFVADEGVFNITFKEEITNPNNETGSGESNSIESTLMELSRELSGQSSPEVESKHKLKPEQLQESYTEFMASNTQNFNSLPEKTRTQYESGYNRLKKWCQKNEEHQITETVLLTYFSERSVDVTSASLWAEYSMLKASLAVKDETDIRSFTKLIAFLKQKAIGYRPKKSKMLTRDQFYRFLTEAPDKKFLLMKVVAIIGIAGACTMVDLLSMTINDIEDLGSVLVIKIPESKTTKCRSFIVNGVENNFNMANVYRRYALLRPPHTTHDRLFVQYRNGKCCNQVVGIHSFGKIASEIAKYLGLPNPALYTGHCFKRSSGAILG